MNLLVSINAMHETVLRMPSNERYRYILRLAAIYRQFFSVLILSVQLENITKVNKNVKVVTNKWPAFLVLLVVTAAAALAIYFQHSFANELPFTQNAALFLVTLSHYMAFAFPLIHSMLNYRKIHCFWCKIYEMTCFASRKLGYELCFEYFWKRFLTDATICLVTLLLHASVRLFTRSSKTHFGRHCCTIFMQEILIFVTIHALFVVNLSSFFIRLLIKNIHLEYRNRSANLVSDHGEHSILRHLHLYKQFHYMLWEMTTAVNGFFGLTVLVLTYHAFIDVAYSAYHIFFYIVLGQSALQLSSNKLILQCM